MTSEYVSSKFIVLASSYPRTHTHYSLLTTYYLHTLLHTTHYALLTTYHSLLTPYYLHTLLHTTHYLLLTTYYSLLTTHYLLLTTYYSLLHLIQEGKFLYTSPSPPVTSPTRQSHGNHIANPFISAHAHRVQGSV